MWKGIGSEEGAFILRDYKHTYSHPIAPRSAPEWGERDRLKLSLTAMEILENQSASVALLCYDIKTTNFLYHRRRLHHH